MPVKSVVQLLIDGRSRVERGWRRYRYRDSKGNVCALGAIGYGRTDVPINADTARAYLTSALPETFTKSHHHDSYDIVAYNDHPATTHDDILSLYDRAIARASLDEAKYNSGV